MWFGMRRDLGLVTGPEGPRSGGGGNRTPVRRCIHERIYVRSPRTDLAALAPTGGISRGQPAFDLSPRPAGADGGPAREMALQPAPRAQAGEAPRDRQRTRLNSSHVATSYAVVCLKKN